jgi:hypothetical protein
MEEMKMEQYQEFRTQYEAQHPASIPRMGKAMSDYPAWLQPLTLIMFIAVSLVSGAHTVSTVHETLEASLIADNIKAIVPYAAFFAFELALFVSVFSWLRKHSLWLPYLSTATVFIVIVVANLQDVPRSLGFDNMMLSTITIGLSFGTPLVALLSGKLFVDIYRANRMIHVKTQEEYTQALKQWDATINGAWTKYQKEQTAREKVHEPKQRLQSFHEVHENFMKPVKRTATREKVHEYLHENPDAIHMQVSELAGALGLSIGLVSEERNNWKQENNGHLS